MNWFRLYAEARNDAKLRSLTDAQHRVWFNLLCFASEQDERGVIAEYDPDLLALEVAGGDLDLLTGTLDRLARLRIVTLTAETVSFIHWLERQYDKPSDRPAAVKERVTRHRAQHGNAPEPPPLNGVTHDIPQETLCNADETPGNAHTQNREYTDQIRSEREDPAPAPAHESTCAHEDQQRQAFDADLADDHPDPPGTPVNRQRKAPRPLPEKPLPKSYPLTEEMRTWAAMEVPELRELDTEHAQFCRHYWSHQNDTRTNWRPVWEKWMTDAITKYRPRTSATGDPSRERSRYESPAERKEREWLESFAYRTGSADQGRDTGQPPALPGGAVDARIIELDSRRVG